MDVETSAKHRRSISGTGYELNIPFGRSVLQEFHAIHRRRYATPIPIVSGTRHGATTVVLKSPQATLAPWSAQKKGSRPVRNERARAHLGREMEVAVHDRQDLVTGRIYKGPAVVTEYSATTVVPETKKFRIDQAGNLIIVTR